MSKDDSKNKVIIETGLIKFKNPEITLIIPILEDITDTRLYASVKSSINAITKYTDSYEIILVTEMIELMDDVLAVKKMYSPNGRISYIIKHKNGLADTLNIGVDYSSGRYIFIHYPMEEVDENRILNQVNDLKSHSISFCSSPVLRYNNEIYNNKNKKLLYNANFNSAGMSFTREAYKFASLKFESYYDDCITKFCFNVLNSDVDASIITSSNIAGSCITLDYKNIDQIHKTYNYSIRGDLTCIIAFRNEKDEVEKTVQSIRATANGVAIILINDASDDNFNYESVARRFNCEYHVHSTPMGAAASKNDGAYKCLTKYFILLDAHMRFYNEGWDDILVEQIQNDPESLYCFNTICFSKDGKYSRNDCSPSKLKDGLNVAGARIRFDGRYTYDLKWLSNNYVKKLDISMIPAVLGASYATSKEYWKKMNGYDGLVGIGFEEPFISLKTWMLGHKCYIINKIGIGHYYRDRHPYTTDNAKYEANRIYLAKWFMNDDEFDNFKALLKQEGIHKDAFTIAEKQIIENEKKIKTFKEQIVVPYSIIVSENDRLKKYT